MSPMIHRFQLPILLAVVLYGAAAVAGVISSNGRNDISQIVCHGDPTITLVPIENHPHDIVPQNYSWMGFQLVVAASDTGTVVSPLLSCRLTASAQEPWSTNHCVALGDGPAFALTTFASEGRLHILIAKPEGRTWWSAPLESCEAP